ncbi:hypothetical protein GCM10010341_88620 [Streptomyces noursei]|nr:hypothetical protein GCM10010341_88620 [Streptomyces noursei]
MNRSVEAGFYERLQVEGTREDLSALLEAQSGAGVQRGEGLGPVLGGQPGCGPLDLDVSEAGEPCAGGRAADEAIGIALRFSVADEDEFCGDHEGPWVGQRWGSQR